MSGPARKPRPCGTCGAMTTARRGSNPYCGAHGGTERTEGTR